MSTAPTDTPVASTREIKALVVFGDSMSDNGHVDGHGFFRSSNGKVWPEYLSDMLSPEKLDVRAWGGATSGQGNYNANASDWSGLLWQVDRYEPAYDMARTLVVVEIGFNDLHDPENEIQPQQVVDNVIKALNRLAVKGVRNLVVWNIFTSPVSPGYTDVNYDQYQHYHGKQDQARRDFAEYNALLPAALAEFEKSHPSVKLLFFDADRIIAKIAERFQDKTSTWQFTWYAPDKDKWFFFDHWHFMTDVHRHIAREIFALLG